ncbi:transposase [Pseudoalteromonas sp. YIC-827]|uniref:Transposase n=1 Tax=Pseudoalteromonas qingdaonensis TaxID=3131913 RepID=A0ABU9MSF1_9GAMM
MSYHALQKGRFSQPQQEYFITFCCARRTPLFLCPQLAQLFCSSIAYHEQTACCRWLTWVLMPDHFHGLLMLQKHDLSSCVQHLKGFTAKQINQNLGKGGRIWQRGFYDHALRSEEHRLGIARYIVANPIRKGIVSRIQDYPYWDSVYL